MHTIVREKGYTNIHPIMTEMERFYSEISEKAKPDNAFTKLIDQPYHFELKEFQDIFNHFGFYNFSFDFADMPISKLDLPKYDEKNILLAFTGGKDSVAAALWYKEHGYNVYLFHVHGITRSQPDEVERAKETAEYLQLPLEIQNVHHQGKRNKNWIGFPFKNIFIGNMMLSWGVRNNIGTTLAFGDYKNASLEDVPFGVSMASYSEMYEAYTHVMQKAIPEFKIDLCLQDIGDTFDMLAKDYKLLSMCQSCIDPVKYRNLRKRQNEKHYGIKLLPHRCGSCWKCAAEYIYMTDHDVLEYNEGYYKHCLDILKKVDKEENGIPFNSIEILWEGYFLYDIKESKYKNIMNYGKRGKRKQVVEVVANG